jgi:hypothetical protein
LEDVELILGREVRAEADLQPLPGKLNIFTVPQGAAIVVNGERRGTSSTTLESVPTEVPLVVEVHRSGYRREREELTLAAAGSQTLNFGALTAESGAVELRIANSELKNPEKLEWFIDGDAAKGNIERSTSNIKLRMDGLELGVRNLRVVHPDYEVWTGSATVRDQQTAQVRVDLEPKPGTLELAVSPGGLRYELSINGESVRYTADGRYTVPAEQALKLELKAQGYKGKIVHGKVAANGSERVPVTLEEITGPELGLDYAFDLGGGEKLELVWVGALNGWVGKYEVTNGQYRRFKSGHNSGEYKGHNLNGSEQPVVEVSFNDAEAYAKWLNDKFSAELPGGYRFGLPNKSQWMTYAQCGDGRKYPWGNSMPPKYGNYADSAAKGSFSWSAIDGYRDGHAVAAPVSSSGRNDWGLYGVGGNVWEWTTETSGSSRVVRGASWGNRIGYDLRCERRRYDVPSSRYYYIGFRVVLFR